MKLDEEHVNEMLGQKCERTSVRAEIMWSCTVQKKAMEQYIAYGEEVSKSWVTAHWQACELRH